LANTKPLSCKIESAKVHQNNGRAKKFGKLNFLLILGELTTEGREIGTEGEGCKVLGIRQKVKALDPTNF
jgi:hypothetical protein